MDKLMMRLTVEDMAEVEEQAKRVIERAKHSKKNEDFGDGRQHGEGRVERNIEGYMAEKAYAKYYGVPCFQQPLTEQMNDGGVDLVINGYKIDVKATSHRAGHMPVKKKSLKPGLRPDIFFFAVVDIHKRVVRMKGWLWASEVKKRRCEKHSPEGSHWIEQKDLRPFKS